MVIDRIESNKIEKYGRIILLCGIIGVVVGIFKLVLATEISLTGLGFWIDFLVIATLPIYLIFLGQKEFKKRSGQFIEWTDEYLAYKLKLEIKPNKILLTDIQKIQIDLDIVEILTKDNQKYSLDISDFENYEDRIKIKDNFTTMVSHNKKSLPN